MKKELVISDIDFIKPAKDTTYADNIIRNLLGNYYLATGDKNFLWRPDNVKIVNEKKSLANSEEDVLISTNEQSNKELVTLLFKMNEWNKLMVDESAINKLKENINGLLSSSFYYGLATQKNTDKILLSDEDKLTQQYGKYFYDYSMVLTSPVVLHQVSQENIDKSTSLVPVAEVQPLYNFYDKDFEKVAADNPEQSLYNYYTLYYYLLEKLDSTAKEKFLNQNVLPLLNKYKTFIDNYLASNNDKDNINNKLKAYKETNPGTTVLKKTIAILPDALKLINEADIKKAEQPFGIDITFPPQPKKTIGTLIGSTSAAIDIENLVSSKDPNITLSSKAYAANLFYNNENNLLTEEYKDIPVISLNKWFKNLEPTKNILLNDNETIAFTKNESDKDSVFLQKIKKVLLQKKIDSLIQENKRSFADIIAGVPAYNEILLFEIIKYANNQPIQSILIPNTEDLDFYKYFDTQIKYDKTYTYEVIAWTFIIGNKYKYFDRIEIPKKKTYKLKNSDTLDSLYFKWFRLAYAFTALQKDALAFKQPSLYDDDFLNIIQRYEQYFVSKNMNLKSGSEETAKMNLSTFLYYIYKVNADLGNAAYAKLENASDKDITAFIKNTAKDFGSLFAAIITNIFDSETMSGADISYYNYIYTFSQSAKNKNDLNAQLDIESYTQNGSTIVNFGQANYSKVQEGQLNFVYSLLSQLKDSTVLNNNFDTKIIDQYLAIYKQINKNNKKAVQGSIDKIATYIEKSFIANNDLFINGGFTINLTDIDLSKDPNYGLNVDNDYYPRFYIKKDNSAKPKLSGQLQLGVYNEVDIILAGLPYVNKTPARVISLPPPPPEVSVIPYKNVSNKIKFFLTDSAFTYRDYPIYMVEQDTAAFDKALEYEKARNLNDGKITFKGDEPSKAFLIYRLEEKPKLYSDFAKGKVSLVNTVGGGFDDNIEPNKKYYYTFRSGDGHGMLSNPSTIYEVEIVENSGAIYPIINIVELEKEDPRTKTISFKEQIKINVNQQHILENATKESDLIKSALSIKGNSFGSLTPSLFGRNFKIRITSKTTKKKIDINLTFNKSFDFKNVLALIEQMKKKAQEKSKGIKA